MILEFWNQFHFLRPAWLLMGLPSIGIWWLLVRASDPGRNLGGQFAPHLLQHLLIRPKKQSWLRPSRLLLPLWLIATVAIAGPSFRRQPSPFAEDAASLVLVVKMTPSMTGEDLSPSRLERVRTKIHDLLDARAGAGTALVAYSGSAHLVMPVTSDAAVIDHMLQSLDPGVMPTEGDQVVEALQLAAEQLSPSSGATGGGSVLLVADGIEPSQLAALRDWRADALVNVQLLAPLPNVAAVEGSGLPEAADVLGASVMRVTPDNQDIKTIGSRADRAIVSADGDAMTQWQDDGHWLVPMVAAGLLFWSRRGWSVNPDA